MVARSDLQVVLVHDWLTGMRGGERCLEALCRRWPGAPLFTLIHRRGSVSGTIEGRPIHTSWLQRLPGVSRYYRHLLPLMPGAAERWRLPGCDAVVSLSHCVAKAAQPPQGVPHVCYCFTPMRYAWHLRESYLGRSGARARALGVALDRMRDWDRRTASRVSHFVAISRTVQQRIRESYDRPSTVIYPPVDTDFYRPSAGPREDYYLVVSALAPYKRLDLAIAACEALGRRLVIIGSGPQGRGLRALAGGNTTFLGWQPDEVVRDHFRRARALLFPGEEDFGIVPVEAQACGAAVIAFGRGGATETVVPPSGVAEPTGLWFARQEADSLADAIQRFERAAGDFSPMAARRHALRFTAQRFVDEMVRYISGAVSSPGVQRAA